MSAAQSALGFIVRQDVQKRLHENGGPYGSSSLLQVRCGDAQSLVMCLCPLSPKFGYEVSPKPAVVTDLFVRKPGVWLTIGEKRISVIAETQSV